MGLPDLYVSSFDYTVNFDLDTLLITLDDDSVYTDVSGVTGTVYTVTSPTGITSTSSNVAPNGSTTIAIYTVGGIATYGLYTISGVLTDDDGTYTVTKTFNLCRPTQCEGDKKTNNGCLRINVQFRCQDDVVYYADITDYTYIDTEATSVEYSVTAQDPNGTLIADAADTPSFTKETIVNGRYFFTVDNAATYDFDDNISVTIHYKVTNAQYVAQCNINLCDVRCALVEFYEEYKDEVNTGSARGRLLQSKIQSVTMLVELIQTGIECGEDVSDYVVELEKLTGKSCSCGCGTVQPNTGVCSCNNIIFEAGTDITIEETTVNNTTTVTISAVRNSCQQNVLWVTPCGSDSTGAVGNIFKPFQTIKGAVAASTSNSNQLIYVFPGTYGEANINKGSDNVEKRGLTYYFSGGATVTAPLGGQVFYTTSDAGNITVRGSGVFNSSSDVILSNTVNMNYDIECKSINNTGSTGVGIGLRYGTLRLNCYSVTATGGSCLDFRETTLGGLMTVYVTANLLDNSTSAQTAATVQWKDCTTSGSVFTFNVQSAKSKATSTTQTICLTTGNTGNPKVYWYGNVSNVNAGAASYGAGVGVRTGTLIFNGDIDCTAAHGATSVGGTLVLKGARVRVGGDYSALITQSPPNTGSIEAWNSNFVNSSSTVKTVVLNGTGFYQLINCTMKNENTSSASPSTAVMTLETNNNLFNNVLIRNDDTSGVSVTTSVASTQTHYINVYSNLAVGVTGAGTYTNIIGTVSTNTALDFEIY